jgi:putative transposase
MTKNVAALRLVDRDEASGLPELSEELRLAFGDIAGAAREGLLAMSVAVGLRVAEMMEEELAAKVGVKHAKLADRTASRDGRAAGSVVSPTGTGSPTSHPAEVQSALRCRVRRTVASG